MTTRLSDPVRIVSTGEVTTIAKLAEQGRIRWSVCDRFYSPRSKLGYRTAYFADLAGSEDEDGDRTGWEIGKTAYLSRTGQEVEL